TIPAVLDRDVAAIVIAGLAQPLVERLQTAGELPRQAEHPDDRRRLLRAHRERPHCRPAHERDERAAVHSITSSARASSIAGRSSPAALALLRLITSSNAVGCTTGRSAGLVPRRIRPAYTPASR